MSALSHAPSSAASRNLFPVGEKSPAATLAPSAPQRAEEGSRGEPGEGVAVTIGAEHASDFPARDRLLDSAMGPRWRRKSSEKLRRGRQPSEGLAFVAKDALGRVVGTVRLWDVAVAATTPSSGRSGHLLPDGECGEATAGPGEGVFPALLLGPLAVDPAMKSAGIGSALMCHAIDEARRLGHRAVILVGDPEYYQRFGFSAERTALLAMPGPFEKRRLLALEIEDGALDGASGVLKPAGRKPTAAPTSIAA